MPVRTKSLHKLDSSFTNADESKRRKASRSRETTQDSTPTCWPAGEIFADGTVLELIRVESEELQLLVWNDTVSCVEPQVKLHGVTYRPIALPVDLGNAILLPTACAEPSISGKALIDAMSKTLTSLIS